jgi:hypothetical protein
MRLRSVASAIVVAIVGTTMIGVSGRTAPPGQPPDGNPNLEGSGRLSTRHRGTFGTTLRVWAFPRVRV